MQVGTEPHQYNTVMANRMKENNTVLNQYFPIREKHARTLQTVTNEKWHNP